MRFDFIEQHFEQQLNICLWSPAIYCFEQSIAGVEQTMVLFINVAISALKSLGPGNL